VTVVVDSSVAIKWLVTEHDSEFAFFLLRTWRRQQIVPLMPQWAQLEVANSLLQLVIRGQMDSTDAVIHLTELARFVTCVESSQGHSGRALMYAQRLGLRAVYDLHFLVLAQELGCELWTADERFWRTVSGEFPFVRWLGNVTVS
jgi:predicted nucleic acid-binding protein